MTLRYIVRRLRLCEMSGLVCMQCNNILHATNTYTTWCTQTLPDMFWYRSAAKDLMLPLMSVNCLLQRTAFNVKCVLALANYASNIMLLTCV